MKRILTVALIVLLICSVAVPAAGVAATGPTDATFTLEDNDTATDTEDNTSLEDETESSDPGTADRVRVSPVDFGEDFLEVSTEDRDSSFNTTGPFAVLTLSEPADNVRIDQSGADATLLEGDTAVLVEYDSDAAGSSSTYFELEAFYDDGSQSSIDLYATETEVSVGAAELEDYRPLIEDMSAEAEDRGYGDSPEELESYHDWMVDRVALLESFLMERAAQLLMLAIMAVENPLVWVFGLVTIIVLTFRREQAHGWILDRIENDAGATARQQEQLESAYRRDKQTANEEAITQLPEINDQQAVYWSDAFDVHSTRQMSELALRGPRGERDAVRADGGHVESAIGQLDPETIHDSWFAKIYTTNRLSGPREALSCMKACLVRMEATYGMGHRYSAVRSDVETLIDELEELEKGF